MKHIYEYWKEQETGREGYTVADVKYHFEDTSKEFDGEFRNHLSTTIREAMRYNKKNKDASIEFYASASLTQYYDDGSLAYPTQEDCLHIGALINGEYFDLCESADWLED